MSFSTLTPRTLVRHLALAAALTCGGIAVAGTTVVAPSDWGALQLVAGANDPGNLLFYPFLVTADQPLSISVTFVPSAYTPGRFDPGFISPGWFYVTRACSPCGMEGNVIFDMAKHYNEVFKPSDTMILIGDGGRAATESGDYVPGATYTTTMVWNRAASTINITVSGGGSSFSSTVASAGDTISGLVFHGPNAPEMGYSTFGDVTVAVPEPSAWLMLSLGLGCIGWLANRRRQRRLG
ncbi:PEP-CTERM sorting domain-containing protein [Paucibacter sp. TC2R-5]|uniref:PEP-CTERM sorting domain-containing protein n=1 Tax=Paucibacter sp. TC2R-5 TaxID=2893555 RepID=UPI0021E39444|nr:PEP-CTERM sorting domain-containing protein [Paucibacter sp. TC2R-5]MCV2358057.1 PEP-CTERM sorting domain-containing protein [Paucibacter sp. TC2R-5]